MWKRIFKIRAAKDYSRKEGFMCAQAFFWKTGQCCCVSTIFVACCVRVTYRKKSHSHLGHNIKLKRKKGRAGGNSGLFYFMAKDDLKLTIFSVIISFRYPRRFHCKTVDYSDNFAKWTDLCVTFFFCET